MSVQERTPARFSAVETIPVPYGTAKGIRAQWKIATTPWRGQIDTGVHGEREMTLSTTNAIGRKALPTHNGEFEYRIRSVNEPDERVVRESQLRANPSRNNPGRPYSVRGRY